MFKFEFVRIFKNVYSLTSIIILILVAAYFTKSNAVDYKAFIENEKLFQLEPIRKGSRIQSKTFFLNNIGQFQVLPAILSNQN